MADEKHYNAAGTHVLVYNPETDGHWESPVDYLPTALARGWVLAEPVEEDLDNPEPSKSKPRRKASKSASTPGD